MAKGLKSFWPNQITILIGKYYNVTQRVEVLGRKKNKNLKQIGQGVHELCSDIQTNTQTEITTSYIMCVLAWELFSLRKTQPTQLRIYNRP